MSSDPDFRETFVKNVTIQRCNTITAKQSTDSLNDYYSAICDTQLSVGSPYKSPDSMYGAGDPFRWRARTSSSSRRRYPMHHRLHGSFTGSSTMTTTATMTAATMATLNHRSIDDGCDDGNGTGPTLVVARRTIERQAIGFNVIDTNSNSSNSASGKPTMAGNGPISNGITFDAMDADIVRKRNECAVSVHTQTNDTSPKRSKSMAMTDDVVTLALATNTTNGHNHANASSPPTEAVTTAIEQTAIGSSTDHLKSSKSDAIDGSRSRWLPMASASNMDCDVVDGKVATPSWSNAVANNCNVSKDVDAKGGGSNETIEQSAKPLMASNCALSLSSSSSSTSSSTTNVKRRYPPFSFRDIRNEILSVMRSRNNPK